MSTNSYVQASGSSALLDLDSLPHAYTYNGNGNLLTDSVTRVEGNASHVYTQTYSYSGTQLVGVSAWVKTS